jgi:hypothetical protein
MDPRCFRRDGSLRAEKTPTGSLCPGIGQGAVATAALSALANAPSRWPPVESAVCGPPGFAPAPFNSPPRRFHDPVASANWAFIRPADTAMAMAWAAPISASET